MGKPQRVVYIKSDKKEQKVETQEYKPKQGNFLDLATNFLNQGVNRLANQGASVVTNLISGALGSNDTNGGIALATEDKTMAERRMMDNILNEFRQKEVPAIIAGPNGAIASQDYFGPTGPQQLALRRRPVESGFLQNFSPKSYQTLGAELKNIALPAILRDQGLTAVAVPVLQKYGITGSTAETIYSQIATAVKDSPQTYFTVYFDLFDALSRADPVKFAQLAPQVPLHGELYTFYTKRRLTIPQIVKLFYPSM